MPARLLRGGSSARQIGYSLPLGPPYNAGMHGSGKHREFYTKFNSTGQRGAGLLDETNPDYLGINPKKRRPAKGRFITMPIKKVPLTGMGRRKQRGGSFLSKIDGKKVGMYMGKFLHQHGLQLKRAPAQPAQAGSGRRKQRGGSFFDKINPMNFRPSHMSPSLGDAVRAMKGGRRKKYNRLPQQTGMGYAPKNFPRPRAYRRIPPLGPPYNIQYGGSGFTDFFTKSIPHFFTRTIPNTAKTVYHKAIKPAHDFIKKHKIISRGLKLATPVIGYATGGLGGVASATAGTAADMAGYGRKRRKNLRGMGKPKGRRSIRF